MGNPAAMPARAWMEAKTGLLTRRPRRYASLAQDCDSLCLLAAAYVRTRRRSTTTLAPNVLTASNVQVEGSGTTEAMAFKSPPVWPMSAARPVAVSML